VLEDWVETIEGEGERRACLGEDILASCVLLDVSEEAAQMESSELTTWLSNNAHNAVRWQDANG
jgi:hypothetical protein